MSRHAASLCARRHIDCYIDRCPICRASPMLGGVSVADNSPMLFGDEIGIARQNGSNAPLHLHDVGRHFRSEEHTSELQSLMRISYAVFCLKKKKQKIKSINTKNHKS